MRKNAQGQQLGTEQAPAKAAEEEEDVDFKSMTMCGFGVCVPSWHASNICDFVL